MASRQNKMVMGPDTLFSRQYIQLGLAIFIGLSITALLTLGSYRFGLEKADARFETDAKVFQDRFELLADSLLERTQILVAFTESGNALIQRNLTEFLRTQGRVWSNNRIFAFLPLNGDQPFVLKIIPDQAGVSRVKENVGNDFAFRFSGLIEDGRVTGPTALLLVGGLQSALQIKPAIAVALPYQLDDTTAGFIFHAQEFASLHKALFLTKDLPPLNVTLYEPKGDQKELFSASPSGQSLTGEQSTSLANNLIWDQQVTLLGLDLRLILTAERARYSVEYQPVILTAILGLVISILVALVLWFQSQRASRITEIVHRRTTALRRANDELENQYTMLQRLNMDLDDSRKSAEAANAAKSEFLATVSHELRTPLNAILGFSQIIRDETLGELGDHRYRDYAADINESGAHLLSLINDILDLAKLEAGKIRLESTPLLLRDLLDRVVVLMQQSAKAKGLSLSSSISPDLPDYIAGDELRLRQVLINLVSNAIKYTPAGSVDVSLRSEPFAGGAPGWVIAVEDTGVGIPPEKKAILFDRFTQVESSRVRKQGGAGLGLSICRELCEMMGGVISVQSIVDKGSVFTVHLPLLTVEDSAALEEDDGFI